MIKTAKMQGNVMVSAVGREPTLRSNMLGADLRSLEFPGDVGDLVGVHTPQELEPEGAKDPVSVCKWEVGGLAVTVALLLWAQAALLPVCVEFQTHPQGCSGTGREMGDCFRQEVPLGPNALPWSSGCK